MQWSVIFIVGKVHRSMLVTIVHLMYEAIAWLHKWRSSLKCMRLTYEHLRQTSVILRQTSDRTEPCSERASLDDDGRNVLSTGHVLWTYGGRQLAVLRAQVKLPLTLTLLFIC